MRSVGTFWTKLIVVTFKTEANFRVKNWNTDSDWFWDCMDCTHDKMFPFPSPSNENAWLLTIPSKFALVGIISSRP